MIPQDAPTTLLAPDLPFSHVRGLVAKVLLEHAGDGTTERCQLTQRAIARMIGTGWETVHSSLKSLQDEGAIRIEHQRIIVKKSYSKVLQEPAKCDKRMEPKPQ